MKHTPGPWTVAYLDQHGQTVVKAEHIEIATCWHHCVGAIEKEMHANANLIAAAPELLEALVFVEERLTRSGYPDGPNLQTLRAAIAKATGASE